jgi:hypothetical protein
MQIELHETTKESLRQRVPSQFEKMLAGDYHITQDEIRKYVADEEWQIFRKLLKGYATNVKLNRLQSWLGVHQYTTASIVQVVNYINALKRGGQLSKEGKIQR